jgi:hypothetical protein
MRIPATISPEHTIQEPPQPPVYCLLIVYNVVNSVSMIARMSSPIICTVMISLSRVALQAVGQPFWSRMLVQFEQKRAQLGDDASFNQVVVADRNKNSRNDRSTNCSVVFLKRRACKIAGARILASVLWSIALPPCAYCSPSFAPLNVDPVRCVGRGERPQSVFRSNSPTRQPIQRATETLRRDFPV